MIDTRTFVLPALVASGVLVASLVACGDQGGVPTATATATPPASAPPSAKVVTSASAKPSASAAIAPPPGDEPKLPPIEIGTPTAQKIGDKSVIGEVCKVNGPV